MASQLAGMGDPATLVEYANPTIITAIPTVIAGEMQGEKSLRSRASDKSAAKDEGGSVEVTEWAWLFECGVKEGLSEELSKES